MKLSEITLPPPPKPNLQPSSETSNATSTTSISPVKATISNSFTMPSPCGYKPTPVTPRPAKIPTGYLHILTSYYNTYYLNLAVL